MFKIRRPGEEENKQQQHRSGCNCYSRETAKGSNLLDEEKIIGGEMRLKLEMENSFWKIYIVFGFNWRNLGRKMVKCYF